MLRALVPVLSLLLSAVVALPAHAALPAGNLTVNPSFESGVASWVSWQGTLARATYGAAPDGSYVAKVTRSTGTAYSIDDQDATVRSTTAGATYSASAWLAAASSSAVNKPISMTLREKNSAGTVVRQTTSPNHNLTSTFARLDFAVTAAGTGNTLEVYVAQSNAVAGDAFYADAITMVHTDTQAPTAPSSLTATPASTSEIDLRWNASTDNVGVSGYAVYRAGVLVATTGGATLTYRATGLAAATTYSFTVHARDAAGNQSASSNAASARTHAPASNGIPTTWRRSASFETDLNSGSEGWNLPPVTQASGFEITRTGEVGGAAGSFAAKIRSNGGNSGCSCPRMKFEDFQYTAGRDVWMRGSWYIPNPGALSWSRMMNLSSYTGTAGVDHYLGLVIEDSGQMLVRSRQYHSTTGQKLVFPPRAIPVGRWFTVHLHFRLSPYDGQALNEWYVDGQLVGTSTAANMYNTQSYNVYQGGMPYFLNNIWTDVYFDNPGLTERN